MRYLALSMSYEGIKYQRWGLAGERIWNLDRRWMPLFMGGGHLQWAVQEAA